MKFLMSDEEFRQNMQSAFNAGVSNTYRYYDSANPEAPDFDEWYEEVYGGPDCE
jgi:hypothetical protein